MGWGHGGTGGLRGRGGSQVTKSFVGCENNLEVYPVLNREPVEVMEDRGEMVT